jgi:hypothetical protein
LFLPTTYSQKKHQKKIQFLFLETEKKKKYNQRKDNGFVMLSASTPLKKSLTSQLYKAISRYYIL